LPAQLVVCREARIPGGQRGLPIRLWALTSLQTNRPLSTACCKCRIACLTDATRSRNFC